jgi:hypothetical protein
MALSILHWQDKPAFEPSLIARFERGNAVEDWVIRELTGLGFHARVDRKAFEIKGRSGELLLRGRVDGFVEWERKEYPLEIKSLNPMIFARIQTIDDFQKLGFLAKYPRQLQAYLYANGLSEGFFLLDDCMGHWKLVPVTLDLEATEAILQQSERAVLAVERVQRAGESEVAVLPDYLDDIGTCRRCWALGRLCTPPSLTGDGLRTIDDPALEELLTRREQLAEAARGYEQADKAVKDSLKGIPDAVVGPFLVHGEQKERNVKAQAARTDKFWKLSIERVLQAGETGPVSEESAA